MADVLTVTQLQRLTEHKYSVQGRSILEPPLQIFWNKLVTYLPPTWAPNSLTMAGLIINVLACLILIWYSPDARTAAPAWALFLNVVAIFIYQTLDALDGKQARRTGSSSPLGELFDHGCDSVSTTFLSVTTAIALQLGTHPGVMFYSAFMAMFLFYCYHWKAYCSGVLTFGTVDVTEGQLIIMAVAIISAIFGSDIWSYELPILDIQLKLAFVFIGSVPPLVAFWGVVQTVFVDGGCGKNGSTIANTSLLFPVLPITVVILLAYLAYVNSQSELFERHPCLFCLTFGLVAAKVTDRLVVAHMTRSEMNLMDSIFLFPLFLSLNQYFNGLINEYYVLFISFMLCAMDLFKYCVNICKQICDYLDISCFKVCHYTPPPPHPQSNVLSAAAAGRATVGNQDQSHLLPASSSSVSPTATTTTGAAGRAAGSSAGAVGAISTHSQIGTALPSSSSANNSASTSSVVDDAGGVVSNRQHRGSRR